MDRWEQRHLRRILREKLQSFADQVLQPILVGLLAAGLAQQRNTQGACGTAREAPTVSSSGDTIDAALDASRDTVSAPIAKEMAGDTSASPALGGAAKAAPSKRRPRTKESVPVLGTDRAGGLGKDDVASSDRREAGGAALESDIEPASIVTAHPISSPPQAETKAQEPGPAPIARPLPVNAARLPIAWSREGCSVCGTRGDLGCAHQRPFGTVE